MEKPASIQHDNSKADEGLMKSRLAFEVIIKELANAPNILEFKPSEKAKARVWELVAREKEGLLTPDERNELDHYAQVEHIMRLVKAQARKRLQSVP